MALNVDNKTFLIYIATLVKLTIILIYFFSWTQVTSLTSNKTRILTKYFDFSNIFFLDSALELSKYTRINNHSINLLNNKQLFYSLIYSLGLVELETLKTYIIANPPSGFISLFKSFDSTLILFIWTKNSSLYLCVDY